MRKYSIITAAGALALTLVITSWWGKISENMDSNSLGYFAFTIIIIGGVSQVVYLRYTSWSKVSLSLWEKPFPNPIWGGIRISNDTWVEMTECKAELVGYDDDFSRSKNIKPIADIFVKDGSLDGENSLLFWMTDGNLVNTINLGRGKSGYIVLAFGVDEQDKKLVSPEPNWIYKINTSSGQNFIHPFDSGYIYVRLSAKFNNEPIKPAIKCVRLEVKEKTLFIKDIENV